MRRLEFRNLSKYIEYFIREDDYWIDLRHFVIIHLGLNIFIGIFIFNNKPYWSTSRHVGETGYGSDSHQNSLTMLILS